MLIVNLKKLIDFSKQHANARKNLSSWISITERAIWNNGHDVLNDFRSARMVKNNLARFKIKHNTYRLVVYINFDAHSVLIRFIGTHSEYDELNLE